MSVALKRDRGTWTSRRGEGEVAKWLRYHANYDAEWCLIFPFSRNDETGYGSFGHEGKQRYAHRFMCELVHGPAPADKPYCAHSCGRGHEGCVHPKHLSWKSISENLLDRRQHGTVRHGSRATPKLTEEQIAQIRALKGQKTQQQLADMFGVKRPAIQYWQKHDRPLTKLKQHPKAVWRRKYHAERVAKGYKRPTPT